MIIATAGHVDHGKTTLLQAITGVNADRLPEEKARGMTIDLGYAYWPQPDGRVLGFIDVPGHEKFLSNMLAGVGGIDHALLVVACDDGVMAQTREHLAILQLTGKPTLTVALTKTDRVTAARVAEVQAEVEQALRELGFDAAAFFPTAAVENLGIAELRSHLLQLAERPHPQQRRFRLALDPPRRGKRKPEYLQWLHALAAVGADDAQALELHLQRDAVRLERFAWARQLSETGMAALIQRPDYLQAGQRLLSAPLAARWQRKLLDALARYHEQHRDEPGPGRERLRRIALPMEDEALVLLLIEQMRESGLVRSHHGWLHLPEHKAGFTDEQQAVWQKVETLFGDDPWWVRDLAREVHVEESLMRAVLRQAAQQGIITAIVKDRYYRNDRIVQFAQRVRELDQLRGSTCAADFRDTLNVGRKLAIQILEYFDRIGFTRRRGNDHILRDKALFL
ncbi:selenocysteine-specific translation elongation factor [Klebsiella quasipneumoniae subsp. similipneumoniae]|uniref:selenocysteine-specific translation elongation factor n=1 Tax=Klebsiella quasipneumoniae TaxID=1463165 RepID=UPI003B86220A